MWKIEDTVIIKRQNEENTKSSPGLQLMRETIGKLSANDFLAKI